MHLLYVFAWCVIETSRRSGQRGHVGVFCIHPQGGIIAVLLHLYLAHCAFYGPLQLIAVVKLISRGVE